MRKQSSTNRTAISQMVPAQDANSEASNTLATRDSGEAVKAEKFETVFAHELSETFDGPLPPPETLSSYESACPGAAERLLALAEKAADHQRFMERTNLEMIHHDAVAERKEARVGQLSGLTIALTAIVCGALIAWQAPGWPGTVAGSILGGGSLASLVAVFITGRRGKYSRALPTPKELWALEGGEEQSDEDNSV